MSIRIREVGGRLIAMCAARSVPKDGDVYLDDGLHYALAMKFRTDYEIGGCPEHDALREVEESNNPNRAEWDRWMAECTRGATGEGDDNGR